MTIAYSPGDIVICKMPSTLKNYHCIDEAHRERPYLLMNSKNGIIEAYPISSNLERELPENQKVFLKKGSFGLSKNSNVLLTEAHDLRDYHLLYKIGSIDQETKKKIDNYSLVNRYYSNNSSRHPMFNRVTEAVTGDIIDYCGKWYYVFEHNGKGLTCFPLTNSYHSGYAQTLVVIPSKKKRYVNVRRQISIKKYSTYQIFYRTESEYFKAIKHAYKSSKLQKELKNSLYKCDYPTGSILRTRDNNYYIYLFTANNSYCGIQTKDYEQNNFYVQSISKITLYLELCPKLNY